MGRLATVNSQYPPATRARRRIPGVTGSLHVELDLETFFEAGTRIKVDEEGTDELTATRLVPPHPMPGLGAKGKG